MDSTADVTSTLGGVSLQINDVSGATQLLNITGSLKHDTKAMTVADGTYTLTGILSGNVLTDGSSVLTITDELGSSYEYITVYEQHYSSGGTDYTVIGIGGIVTDTGDVPNSGIATYTGEAKGKILLGSTDDLNNGTSTVVMNFNSALANVTLAGFDGDHVLDTINVVGMSISGNSFSGGTITTEKNNAVVNLTGAGTTSVAQGRFFGYDDINSIPDEVGGIILINGDSGTIFAGFAAD
ncbi:MAG: hypothetical protein V3V13_00560 [Paracoccaceae bacterium]